MRHLVTSQRGLTLHRLDLPHPHSVCTAFGTARLKPVGESCLLKVLAYASWQSGVESLPFPGKRRGKILPRLPDHGRGGKRLDQGLAGRTARAISAI